jgi:hypothetical protein
VSKYAVNGKEPIAAWIPSRDTAGNGTTTLTDLVGSNNGTLTNMVAASDWVADTDAGGVRALDFDGVNDFVSLPNTVQIPDEYTICGWVKIAANRATILGFSASDSAFRSSQWGTTGLRVPYFQISLAGGYFFTTGGGTLNAGQWYHLAFTRSGATAKVYVNGVDTLAATSGGAVGGMLANTNTRRIGSNVTGGASVFADARQDDIRIFNQVLTLADIEYLYAGGFGRGRTRRGIIPILRQHYAAQGAR